MSVFATDTQRLGNVLKHEYEPQLSFCREVVTINDAAATLKVGAVLGAFIASPAATAAAKAGNTGNGAMGAITATSGPGLQIGVYKLQITAAVANAGNFSVTDPDGRLVGNGAVATAFVGGGLSFTLADGATDFVVGDAFDITVTGTEKYKLVEATATDGSQVAAAVLIADGSGNSSDLVLVANTDTKALVLARGPVIVAKESLQFGASVDTAGEKQSQYDALKAVGIIVEAQV